MRPRARKNGCYSAALLVVPVQPPAEGTRCDVDMPSAHATLIKTSTSLQIYSTDKTSQDRSIDAALYSIDAVDAGLRREEKCFSLIALQQRRARDAWNGTLDVVWTWEFSKS